MKVYQSFDNDIFNIIKKIELKNTNKVYRLLLKGCFKRFKLIFYYYFVGLI